MPIKPLTRFFGKLSKAPALARKVGYVAALTVGFFGVSSANQAQAATTLLPPKNIVKLGVLNNTDGQPNGGVNWGFDNTKTNRMQVFYHLAGSTVTNASAISNPYQQEFGIWNIAPGDWRFNFVTVDAKGNKSALSGEKQAIVLNIVSPPINVAMLATNNAVDSASNGSLSVGFKLPVATYTGVLAYHKSGSTITNFINIPKGATQSTISGLSSGFYGINIASVDSKGQKSDPTAEVAASVGNNITPPPPPPPVQETTGSVPLTWEPTTDPSVAGYKIYYGEESHNYKTSINVGKVTSAAVEGLARNKTYYFSATTYDTEGNESDFSNEAKMFVPPLNTNANTTNPPSTSSLAKDAAILSSGLLGSTSPGANKTFQMQLALPSDFKGGTVEVLKTTNLATAGKLGSANSKWISVMTNNVSGPATLNAAGQWIISLATPIDPKDNQAFYATKITPQ